MPHRVTIRGRKWTVRHAHIANDGDCDPPSVPPGERVIRIRSGLRGERHLAVAIHEFLHADDWRRKHRSIDRLTRDLTAYLACLGYHRDEPPRSPPARDATQDLHG